MSASDGVTLSSPYKPGDTVNLWQIHTMKSVPIGE